MTSKTEDRTGPHWELFGGRATTGPTGLLYSNGYHYLTVWLAPLDYSLEVVAIELRPRRNGIDSQRARLQELKNLKVQLAEMQSLYERGRLERVTFEDMRSMSFPNFFRDVENLAPDTRPVEEWAVAVDYGSARVWQESTDRERATVEYLNDALIYSDALRRGNRAPAQVIASARSISVRTAQGRVARARALGYLTEAPRGRVSKLSPRARELADLFKETYSGGSI